MTKKSHTINGKPLKSKDKANMDQFREISVVKTDTLL